MPSSWGTVCQGVPGGYKACQGVLELTKCPQTNYSGLHVAQTIPATNRKIQNSGKVAQHACCCAFYTGNNLVYTQPPSRCKNLYTELQDMLYLWWEGEALGGWKGGGGWGGTGACAGYPWGAPSFMIPMCRGSHKQGSLPNSLSQAVYFSLAYFEAPAC